MLDRHSYENTDKNNMNFNQTRRMRSETLYSQLMQTKNDWKKADTLLNKHKINTQTNWVNRELQFTNKFHDFVNNMLQSNDKVNDKTDDMK